MRNIFQSLYENVCFFPVQWSVHARSPDSVARGYQSMQSRWKSEYIISNYVSVFLSARVNKGGDKKERREGEKINIVRALLARFAKARATKKLGQRVLDVHPDVSNRATLFHDSF